MNIGVISSSHGSVLSEVVRITVGRGHKFFVVTDRSCGTENVCRMNNIEHCRITEPDNREFSVKAANYLRGRSLEFVILFFTRIVTEELYNHFPTMNIHESLLPAFKGMGAIEKAYSMGVKYFGCTLHRADGDNDGGPIIAQSVMPIGLYDNLASLQKYAFIQKIYLFLIMIERMEHSSGSFMPPVSDRFSPVLTDKTLLEGVKWVQKREGVEVVE